jgi:hypothetical protein
MSANAKVVQVRSGASLAGASSAALDITTVFSPG